MNSTDEFVHVWKYGEKFTSMDAMYIYIGAMIVVAFIRGFEFCAAQLTRPFFPYIC